MNGLLLFVLIIVVIVVGVIAVIFSIRLVLKILKLLSVLLLIVGIGVVAFSYFELTHFQDEFREETVFYALVDDGEYVAGAVSREGVFSVASQGQLQNKIVVDDRVLLIEYVLFEDEIDMQLEYAERSVAFSVALEKKLEKEGGLFIVEGYVNNEVQVTPPLHSLRILSWFSFSDEGFFFSPLLEQFRKWRNIIE